MAYNPFRAFRKHQKAMFAGLTILCMVTFVLTGSISAGWDFFQGLLPGSGKNGPDVATIYGKPVYDHELRLLAQQRDFANTFIRVAISRASDKSITAALKALADSPIDKQVLQQVEQVASFRLSPQFATYFQFFFPQLVQLRETQAAMQKPQEAALIQQVENGLFRLYDLMRRPPQEFFFGGTRDPKDLIDFLI
ncbi:MAG TPA: hypothetical protein VGZ47_16050, partial [Gemmataceae bacterium]|nr:hypothetical protein [Gemmataceae bacterium]